MSSCQIAPKTILTTEHFSLRPQKAFRAAWVACGYFEQDHFPAADPMSQAEAIQALDETGMLRKLGVPSDMVGETLRTDRRGR